MKNDITVHIGSFKKNGVVADRWVCDVCLEIDSDGISELRLNRVYDNKTASEWKPVLDYKFQKLADKIFRRISLDRIYNNSFCWGQ